jgi:hypothetical protein
MCMGGRSHQLLLMSPAATLLAKWDGASAPNGLPQISIGRPTGGDGWFSGGQCSEVVVGGEHVNTAKPAAMRACILQTAAQ